jgi:hypothetical protein
MARFAGWCCRPSHCLLSLGIVEERADHRRAQVDRRASASGAGMGEPGYPVSGGCCTVHSSRWALLPVRISLGRSPDRHEAAANILTRLRAEQLSRQRIYPPQPSR